jgi:hypothetical protein
MLCTLPTLLAENKVSALRYPSTVSTLVCGNIGATPQQRHIKRDIRRGIYYVPEGTVYLLMGWKLLSYVFYVTTRSVRHNSLTRR